MEKLSNSWLHRTIELAYRGRYQTAPNPMVGCVILDNRGYKIAEGYHQVYGGKHAELLALEQVGSKAKGGTLYVNLEPCCHQGKQPPCTQAIIDAGISKVFIGSVDPNPAVSGKGILKLRQAGLEIILADENDSCVQKGEYLNRRFFHVHRTKKPWVSLKVASSLDGKIALASGESQWITSPKARELGHELRAEHQAIISTSQTVLQDNASLNVRLNHICQRAGYLQPTRVILDRRLELSQDINLFHKEGKIILLYEPSLVKPDWQKSFSMVDCVSIKDLNDLGSWLSLLQDRYGLEQFLVEAGSGLATSFFVANRIDECFVFMASVLLGDTAQSFNHLKIEKLYNKKSFFIDHLTPIDRENFLISIRKNKN